jgi:hypothetical protein
MQIESLLAGEGQGEGKTATDAECEENVGGITLRLQTPECQEKPEISFEQQMLLALEELSGKSMDLYKALKLQFTKNQKLAAGKRMKVIGDVVIKPKQEGEPAGLPQGCSCSCNGCCQDKCATATTAKTGDAKTESSTAVPTATST